MPNQLAPQPEPLSQQAKALLIEAAQQAGVNPRELSRRLGVPFTTGYRIFDTAYTSKLDTLEQAAAAIGKRLRIVLE